MKRNHRSRLAIIVVLAFAFFTTLATTIPSKALYCERDLDPACRLVFGTYCKVTRQNPCLP